ncbi:MAG: redox-sensing transcriptional repressor Rex [Kiritimatiellae bacterium]|nr:redox-sensing transcriptional repressor Rex [Kiritimatiellia bacterium]
MSATKEVVVRLTKYKNVLEKLRSLGFVKVFSDNLADAVGVSPALVRKDFSVFGLTGKKRAGYQVDDLIAQLNRILGVDEVQRVIVVGCGKIGTALMRYRGFARERIRVVAGFDVDPSKIDPNAPIPIRDINEMPYVVKSEKIQVAILAVPETVASQVAEQLIAAGIRGILNFAPILLKSQNNVVVQNINIALELENLFCLLRFAEQGLERGRP